MKKTALVLAVLAFVFLFTSCADTSEDKNENIINNTTESAEETSSVKTEETTVHNVAESTTEEPTTEETVTSAGTDVLPLNADSMEFLFSSGAGAWRTVLTLNSDGTFNGEYHDSEMGSRTDDYPNGTAYVCSFSGKFTDFVRLDDNSYSMKLEYVNSEKPEGEEWISDGIRYIASGPYGIYGGTEFVLYLPSTPVDSVPEEFLYWWPGRYAAQNVPDATLDCYGILNVAKNEGFFSES